MGQVRGWRPRRWLALVVLTTVLTVQFSPYAAWARLAPTPRPADQSRGAAAGLGDRRLAQLHALPNGTVTLPDFTLTEDTFQFSNGELVGAIDLQRQATQWETVLTEQLQQVFGTQVCIGAEVKTCVLTAAARDWLQTQLERLEWGLGEGMAAAVLGLWQANPPQSIPWWQQLLNFLLGRVVFGLARSLFELQTYIANFFLMQGVAEVFQATQAVRDTLSPTQILLRLLDVLLTGALDPLTMGLYRVVDGALTEGHSLTPYQITDRGDGKYWVYVYDSNYPAARSTTPPDLHIEFDTQADTWRYQPTPATPAFYGDAQSHNLDLTPLSWRQVETTANPPYRGPFTCPFCRADATASQGEPTVDITLIGEGQLTVTSVNDGAAAGAIARVPFKGGLRGDVPASYRLTGDALDQPLKITLVGTALVPAPATLQIVGPGYTADFQDLPLTAGEMLTLYVVPHTTGPELTLVTNRAIALPHLAIYLTDDVSTDEFDTSTPAYFALTERTVAKSSGFELRGVKLPAGTRVAIAANNDYQRLYFADDDGVDTDYDLTVKNRIVIRDRVQIGERQPDFINYTLTYEEDLRARSVQVEGATQAYFDYAAALVDPADRPREDLLTAFEQRDFPVAIAYEPLLGANRPGPLRLLPTAAPPIAERVFQGALRKAAPK